MQPVTKGTAGPGEVDEVSSTRWQTRKPQGKHPASDRPRCVPRSATEVEYCVDRPNRRVGRLPSHQLSAKLLSP